MNQQNGDVILDKEIEEFLTEIVDRIRVERKKRDISQLKLANILGFQSPNYIAKIETRKHGVSYNLSHIYQIAVAFNIEVIDLIPKINCQEDYSNKIN